MKHNFTFLAFLFLLFADPANAQEKNNAIIQGFIQDDSGRLLAGSTVLVTGTQISAAANSDGTYTLRLPAGKFSLRFSFIGYETINKEVNIIAGQKLQLNVVLSENNNALQLVEITGRKEKTYKTKSTFIGNKTETDIKDLPQSVSYASKELMADQGAVRVGDVVKNFSGVSQFTFYDDLTIRGFRVNGQSNTQLVNGFRTSTGFWKQPLTNYLERVEVLKGPSSALYGNASPGGVVNRVTKKPLDETRKSISFSLGSFNTFRALADFTGPANKDSSLLYRLNLGYEDANSFRDLQFDKNVIVAPSLSFVASPKTRLNFDLVYNSSRSRLDRGQAVIGNDLYSTPQSLALSAGNDYLNEQTYIVSLSLNHQFTNKLSFNAGYSKTGYQEDLYEHRSANAYAKDKLGADIPNLVAMQIFQRKRKRYIDNFTGYFNYNEKTGPIQHKIVAGYDYGSEKMPVGASQLTASGYRNAANTGTIASYVAKDSLKYRRDTQGNPVPNVASFNLNDILNSQRLQDDSKSIFAPTTLSPTYYYLHAGYVQDQLKIGRLQALLGIRYEYYTDFLNYATPTQQKTHSSAWLPRFGLVYTASSNINIYSTYVMGYNPQTAATIANPNAGGPFAPVTSNMIELGAKSSWLDDRLAITTSIYQIEQKNTLYNANVAGQPDLLRPVGKERSRGVEFDITGRITPYWSLLASYAYNDAKITESGIPAEVGLQKPNAPKNMANIWTRYNITKGKLSGMGLGLGANYVDRRTLSINVTQSIPSYTLVDAALFYNIGKVQLQFNANNITGKKYWVGGYDYIRLFPGAPSNYLLTLTYTFN
ncbi:TonB-dependent receptor [Mucilaginibacter phyllosphaerae]|uniref:Iron complex outermembrane receptor protein n=1 Tax=Mucilaginibacter phyllosphaerae TaxID=1812349 RepID=A0A4Y8AFA3_9SPHI|nr:TonB-dependent receptor [Mucilaginibacter phyllosphaerae]MBB3968933.1 iron complex outermembrane receptor protein [Mucilaginibacter phyllosphaerae]TEW67444.1 TonB-dependent receptor [Mucilaginibacter phyllosphaerae]GGH23458.1 ligand-gated channel [Mucilaginibacter phyllosphaerae]